MRQQLLMAPEANNSSWDQAQELGPEALGVDMSLSFLQAEYLLDAVRHDACGPYRDLSLREHPVNGVGERFRYLFCLLNDSVPMDMYLHFCPVEPLSGLPPPGLLKKRPSNFFRKPFTP